MSCGILDTNLIILINDDFYGVIKQNLISRFKNSLESSINNNTNFAEKVCRIIHKAVPTMEKASIVKDITDYLPENLITDECRFSINNKVGIISTGNALKVVSAWKAFHIIIKCYATYKIKVIYPTTCK